MEEAMNAVGTEEVLTSLTRTGQRRGLESLFLRLNEITAWLADDLGELEAALAEEGPEHLARRTAEHLLARPGKRVRPLCVVLAARLGDRHLDAVVRGLAVAAELVHNATLLHDDTASPALISASEAMA